MGYLAALIGFITIVLLSGCSLLGPSPDLVRELAKDPASAFFSGNSIYGTIRLCRSGLAGAVTIVCNQDGMTVKPAVPEVKP